MQILFNTTFIAHFIATQILHNIGHGFEGKLARPIAPKTIFYSPHSHSFSSKTRLFRSYSFFCSFSLQDHQHHHIPRLETDGSYTVVHLYNGHLRDRRKWPLRGGRGGLVKRGPLVEEECIHISTLCPILQTFAEA